ncbi:MAG: condensation domain-containing protein, partial [Acidobacteriota bacterium]
WSADVLLRELAMLHRSIAARGVDAIAPADLARSIDDAVATLPAVPTQVADHAAWERTTLDADRRAAAMARIRGRLDDLSDLELSTDRPRPALRSRRGGVVHFRLDAPTVDALGALAHDHRATLFMVLSAAYQVLLQRHSQQNRFVIGTPVSGRGLPELDGLIGFFANMVALRADLRSDAEGRAPRFADLLRAVRDDSLAAYDEQQLPFETVVEALASDRGRTLARTPVFQVMLVLQNHARAGHAAADTARAGAALPLRLRSLQAAGQSARFDLSLVFGHAPDGALNALLEYDAELFDRTTAQRMVGHVTRLLRSVLETPERPIDALPMRAAAETHALRYGWNDTRPRAAADAVYRAVADRIADQAQRAPDRIALIADGERVRYGALLDGVDRLASALHQRLAGAGVGFDATPLIGVCIRRSALLPALLLAVHRAGGAYVPLDPDQPAPRLALMLNDLDADGRGLDAVLSDGPLPAALEAERPASIEVFDLAAGDLALPPRADAASLPTRGPQTPAYVLYTSGSTGRPKGV